MGRRQEGPRHGLVHPDGLFFSLDNWSEEGRSVIKLHLFDVE